MMNRVDEYNRRPFAFRFLEERNQVHAADVHILTPEHDGPTVGNVKHVIAVTVAEVCRLGRLTRSRADVARFNRDRAKPFKEMVSDVLHHSQ